jgi:hypothetical protein
VIVLAGLTILKKETCLGIVALPVVIQWLHSTSGVLQITAYLLLDHMAPK